MSVSKSKVEKRLSHQLRCFADAMSSDEKFLKKEIRRIEKVRRTLEEAVKKQNFKIASTHYGGSIGKGTDVNITNLLPDFDVVMKINDREPPFCDVLQFFQQTLTNSAGKLQIKKSTILVTPYSIQFSLSRGIKVDLLPASASLTEAQVLQKMKGSFKNRRYYSSSLVEKQVEFMKRQKSFAHPVSRLAKFWYKSMDIHDHHISGGSTIFELLAVAAVLEEGDKRPESMWSAFNRVVAKVESIDTIQLAFENCSGPRRQTWRIRDGQPQGQNIPYILEPSNPTNNFMDGLIGDKIIVEALKRNARVMKDRLEDLLQTHESPGTFMIHVNFQALFGM